MAGSRIAGDNMSELLCSKCHIRPATSNRYCRECNAERIASLRKASVLARTDQTETPDTLALARRIGLDVSADVCLFVDALTEAQVLFLLEHLYGSDKAQQMIADFMQQYSQ